MISGQRYRFQCDNIHTASVLRVFAVGFPACAHSRNRSAKPLERHATAAAVFRLTDEGERIRAETPGARGHDTLFDTGLSALLPLS